MKKHTNYDAYHSNASKKMFHSPETYGQLQSIEMTPKMMVISVISMIIQVGLTVFAIYAATHQDYVLGLADYGQFTSVIYYAFPLIVWIFTLGFRAACNIIPMDMWRLPMDVKSGMKLCKGSLLKLMTLLIELETAICFLYVCIALYLGSSPSSIILLLWLFSMAVSIVIPCRKAKELYYSSMKRKKDVR